MKNSYLCILLVLAMLAVPTSASDKGATLQMTATLENSDTDLQYNYAENIGDGRGITFGICGFCTGTYDGNILIKHYAELNPSNSLAKYIPALNKIDAGKHSAAGGDGNPNVVGLDGFIRDVQNCNDPLFKQAQIDMLDELYYNPAMKLADSAGAKNALTRAFIYDMSVRHGPDGAQSIIKKAGTTPKNGANENTFLSNLITARDAELKKEGLGDTSRDAGFKKVLSSGNVALATPYKFVAYGDTFTIDGNIDLGGTAAPVVAPIPVETPSSGTLIWKGVTWDIRSEAGQPGPNAFNPSGVYVDNSGRMHLTITKVGNVWKCSEVDSRNKYGYGTFTWKVDSPIFSYDKNSVVGLFTYLDDTQELDVEISRWGVASGNNLWYSVQPYSLSGNNFGSTENYAGTTIHTIVWTPEAVKFKTTTASGEVLSEFTYSGKVPSNPQYAVMNLWLTEGKAPSNGKNIDLIISDFSYVEYKAVAPVVTPTPESDKNKHRNDHKHHDNKRRH